MAIKQKCPEFENHERWLVSYADMVTLLFAVFVVLYALQIAKQSASSPTVEQVAGSLQESFNKPLDEIPIDRRVGPDNMGFGPFEHMKGNQARPPLIQKFPSSGQKSKLIDNELARIKLSLEDRLYGPNKHRDAEKAGADRIVQAERTKNGFKLSLTARHFFASGETNVRREALRELEQVGTILKELGRPITVEGHTDSIPSSGNFSNWEISALRAANVGKFFIRNLNLPASKVSIAGYADTKPIASDSTESGRAINRRIEIHVNYDPDSTPDTND